MRIHDVLRGGAVRAFSARFAGWFCALALLSAVAAPAHATKIERVVSPGGIEAWLVRDTTVPLVAMQFAFVGGSSQDPADKSGVANMVTALLDEGAGDLDSAAFQDRLERKAIEMRFSADRDHFRGSLRTLSENRDEAIDLLRLALTQPRFDKPAVDRIRNQIASQLRRESMDPAEIANKTWWKKTFPDHPYGKSPKGTLETIEAVTDSDLKAYTRRVLARDTLKVAIVGDIEVDAAAALLDRVFGTLPAKAELTPVKTVDPSGLGSREMVNFETPQTVVALGGPGLPRKHPDFIPAFVVNHILGGGSFTSRLYREIREKRGLAYGVSTYLHPLDHSALFIGWTQVRADRAPESVRLIEHEITRMAESGPTEEELARAKEYLTGSYALRFDTSSKIAGQLVQIQLDGLGIDYINQRNELIKAVTIEDARRAAKEVFSGGLSITIVGRPVGMAPAPAKGSGPG